MAKADAKTAPQPDLLGGMAPWLLGNLVIVARFVWDIRNLGPHGLIGGHVVWGRDFINLWTAGKAALTGQVALLYDLPAYHRFQTGLFGAIDVHNYSYPPLALPLAVPFALVPYWLALSCWIAGTGWLFARAAAPWWRRATGWPLLLVLLTPAALVNIWAGHYGFLIGALLLFGWRHLQAGRPWWAGLCFGLMAIKPHLAVLIPLVLVLRGEGRAILAGGITLVLLGLVSLLLFGWSPWQAYLGPTAALQTSLIDAGGNFYGTMATSPATALFALGVPTWLVWTGQGLMASLGIGLCVLAARRGSLEQAAFVSATATFLVLPYAFNYDLTVVALAAAATMRDPAAGRIGRSLALGGFLAPQLGMVLAALGLPIMPVLLLGLCLVQVWPILSGRRDDPAGAGAARST